MDDEQIGILGRDIKDIARISETPFFKHYKDREDLLNRDDIIDTYSKLCHKRTPEKYCKPFKTLVAAIADPEFYNYEEMRERILAPIVVQIDYSAADGYRAMTQDEIARGIVPSGLPPTYAAARLGAAYKVERAYKDYPPPLRKGTWF